ncbi:hypothetical protein [Desulfosarcina sp.]|uniref:hypothetical protein n=1 Tax=Desulfosarcina sp. TaxID=2027861 RepID=UPI0035614ABC
MRKIETTLFMAALAFAIVACSGSSARMIPNHIEETHVGRPIKDVLIIAVLDNQEIRAVLEKHFQDWLKVKGVDAIVSADLLPMNAGTKLEKEAIAAVVDKYENDTILITRLVGMEESEVFSRDRPQYFFNYYGFYNYGLAYVTWPTVYGEKVKLSLETALYDVETESPIWAGESQLKNPKTTGQAIGQVVDLVMKELGKNGLLPKAP